MPRIALASADTPFGQRLIQGLGYPLRGSGLATCVALALIHYVALLPSYIGALASALVWAATWRYAADCLLRTAHGYADPPDVGSDSNSNSGWGLTAIHLMVVALCVLAIVFWPHLLWPVLLVATLVLPAIDMSLAFDGSLVLALNPVNWVRIMRSFGLAYLLPVAINLALGLTILMASVSSALLPRILALPLFAFAYTWLTVLAFHLMGVMIHQRHERFGIEPEAPKLARAGGQDSDEMLLQEVDVLARVDPDGAARQLAARLRDRAAPAGVHQAYRQLLKQQHLRQDLLIHGQIWIAALIADNEPRRALGVLQDCTGIDPEFVPDDTRTCGELADLAARLGMQRVALQLCHGYLAHWPRDPQALHYGLLATRLLSQHMDQRAEASLLLEQLASQWPDLPQRREIDTMRSQMAGIA
jgi:hypothetical protein